MGFLEDMMSEDMATFTDPDGFGESGVYTPVTGTPRTINVAVERDPPVTDQNLTRPKMIITVKNDSTLGIASSELDTGGDTFTIAYRKGATAEAFAIQRHNGPGAEDSAQLILELH